MANPDRVILPVGDLPRYFCDDQGREMGRNFKSIQEVISVARKFKGDERDIFLNSFIAETYSSRFDMFRDWEPKDAKAVIKIFLEVSIQVEEEAHGPIQPKLPDF